MGNNSPRLRRRFQFPGLPSAYNWVPVYNKAHNGDVFENTLTGDIYTCLDATDPSDINNWRMESDSAPGGDFLPLAGGTMDEGAVIELGNGSQLKEGGFDHGGGGGIAQRCAVGYETKWEAGSQYIMTDGGAAIREVRHKFANTPTVDDDATRLFVVGSRWILDDDTLYICTDNSDGAAVWELQPTMATEQMGIDLSGYSFPAQDMSFRNFAYADLSNAALTGATTWLGTNFNCANLEGATF